MLESDIEEKNKILVFNCIVHVIFELIYNSSSRLTKIRKKSLDIYIEKIFNFTNVHSILIDILIKVMEKSYFEIFKIFSDEENSQTMIQILKCVEYIFRFIIVSEIKNKNNFVSIEKFIDFIVKYVKYSENLECKLIILEVFLKYKKFFKELFILNEKFEKRISKQKNN